VNDKNNSEELWGRSQGRTVTQCVVRCVHELVAPRTYVRRADTLETEPKVGRPSSLVSRGRLKELNCCQGRNKDRSFISWARVAHVAAQACAHRGLQQHAPGSRSAIDRPQIHGPT